MTISVHGQAPDRDLVRAYLNAGAHRVIIRTQPTRSEDEMLVQLEGIAQATL